MDQAQRSSEHGKQVTVNITRWDLIVFNVVMIPRLRATWIQWIVIAFAVVLLESRATSTSATTRPLVTSVIDGVVIATLALLISLIISPLYVLVPARMTTGVLGQHVYTFQND